VSPAFPSLSCVLPLVQAHLLTPSVHFVLQQIERGIAIPKHIVAPRISSRLSRSRLEAIEEEDQALELPSSSCFPS
jgi:hypothetical protein